MAENIRPPQVGDTVKIRYGHPFREWSMIPEIAVKFLRLLGSNQKHEAQAALVMLQRFVAREGISWNEFLDRYVLREKLYKENLYKPARPQEPEPDWQQQYENLRNSLHEDFRRMENETPEQRSKRHEQAYSGLTARFQSQGFRKV